MSNEERKQKIERGPYGRPLHPWEKAMTTDAKLLEDDKFLNELVQKPFDTVTGAEFMRLWGIAVELQNEKARQLYVPSGWIPVSERPPEEGEIVLIGGYGSKGRFYAEALYKGGEYLMFDQESDRHCWPCQYPLWWQPMPPLPERPR